MDEADYYYRDIIDGASDADSVDSSDDDANDYRRLFDYGKHLSKEDKEVLLAEGVSLHQEEEDSNLSFEREMEKEASSHVNGFHVNEPTAAQRRQPSAATATSLPAVADGSAASSVPPHPVASTSKTREQQNDELFYDPDEDDRDQEWADAHRAKHSAPPTVATSERAKKLAESAQLKKAESDATLNCPCCLSLLCLDCQRHDIYKTQYRAMFVLNCRIDYSKKLLHKDKEQKRQPFKRSKKQRRESSSAGAEGQAEPGQATAESDLYYAVHCATCNTQVALYDMDQVYHFFSVIASH